ncbi:hypothetical protein BpHYR1_005127 [Brachionus plicatilis]|uniref:Uncharacterized protein n=1 Tax=Brachionus plicatilis TaxID=10195 RepID=A0A3M7SP82_BRAPC|nr:hypothetical protein BpHYR1_005127 [Brachionus plicatilis]
MLKIFLEINSTISLISYSSSQSLKSLKPRVYVRPCTKYPTYGIKACVAKQGETILLRNYGINFSLLFVYSINFDSYPKNNKEHFYAEKCCNDI